MFGVFWIFFLKKNFQIFSWTFWDILRMFWGFFFTDIFGDILLIFYVRTLFIIFLSVSCVGWWRLENMDCMLRIGFRQVFYCEKGPDLGGKTGRSILIGLSRLPEDTTLFNQCYINLIIAVSINACLQSLWAEEKSDWLLLSSSPQGLRELQGLTDLPESRRREVF